LPITRFEPFQWLKARVNVDYHVAFENRLYSVPHALVGERVEVRATALTVEIFHGNQRGVSETDRVRVGQTDRCRVGQTDRSRRASGAVDEATIGPPHRTRPVDRVGARGGVTP